MNMPPGFDRLQMDGGAASDRSPSTLSSPPSTPQNHDTIRVAHPAPSHAGPLSGEGVAYSAGVSAHASNVSNTGTHAHNGQALQPAAALNNGSTSEKPKRQRKKKEVGPDGKPVDDGKPKERKPRKPREPKDKTASNASPATGPRKKQKLDDKITHDIVASSRQPTLTEMVNGFQQPNPPVNTPSIPPQIQHRTSLPPPLSNPPTTRPTSSGQNYDPVRGYDPVRAATMEAAQQQQRQAHRNASISNGPPLTHLSSTMNRASASPSIASLIDPPSANFLSTAQLPPTYSPQTNMQQPPPFVPSQPQSPTPKYLPPAVAPSFSHPAKPRSPPPPSPPMVQAAVPASLDGAMDVDLVCDVTKPEVEEVKVAPSKSSSSAPTPKAARPTPPPAPKGTGSGLLSKSNLFGGPSEGDTTESPGVTIDFRITLDTKGGNTINIAQEIAKRYGHDALNPRAAAHRDQMRKLLSASNQQDGGSADDMSVDLVSEAGDDSNVEMGGMDDEKSGTGADKPVRKRRKKIEEYDKEDDFIDDTELAWQEQAAVAKDGFFVYSGPLVPEGTTANVESAAPSGRGRGRGRGSRGGRAAGAAAGTTHASLAAEKANKDAAASPVGQAKRARARRATGAPRKPRATKAVVEADREMKKTELEERRMRQQQQTPLQNMPPRAGGLNGASMPLLPIASSMSASTATPQHGHGGPQGTPA
ncbi:hypothetical protein BAUCODRAFT_128665 [Baudoinia panamericana UAMH 10762]|uniref:Hpc2-related domain-containing protein n=1 Tax=Baudoinia panamericana (strain UAMH 10762) TaxID=717646 RepID=M2NKN6_BAUPA|nr:uncharacterized protein BAUCODRAFT_128665 [Baudoinia panamericana UAMH 10762]EMC99989.1 hypothetical protein BAUCODRAFT_128665 [Baudoinia panamericana UAMH 10762]